MALHVEIAGLAMVAIALAHAAFPRAFAWKEELARLSLINRQMMKVHSAFIALTLALAGLLCLTSADALVGTPLGRRVALGLGIFWTARLLTQLFVYSPRLWRGKPRETAIHVLFVAIWTYFGTVFLLVAFALPAGYPVL